MKEFSYQIHWRESVVAKIMPKEWIEKRWKKMGYEPKSVQLKLF